MEAYKLSDLMKLLELVNIRNQIGTCLFDFQVCAYNQYSILPFSKNTNIGIG